MKYCINIPLKTKTKIPIRSKKNFLQIEKCVLSDRNKIFRSDGKNFVDLTRIRFDEPPPLGHHRTDGHSQTDNETDWQTVDQPRHRHWQASIIEISGQAGRQENR